MYPTIKNAALLNCGWDFLLECLYAYISMLQTQYLKLTPNQQTERQSFAQADKPIVDVTIDQIKEKFGTLRIYLTVSRVEFDWDVFDKEAYEKEFLIARGEIYGYSAAVENISGYICANSGDRGTRKLVGGWYLTLSDAEYIKECGRRGVSVEQSQPGNI
jgi:hypothetical protein